MTTKLNPTDYDYMDKMDFTGWIWELIRRDEKYLGTMAAFRDMYSMVMQVKEKGHLKQKDIADYPRDHLPSWVKEDFDHHLWAIVACGVFFNAPIDGSIDSNTHYAVHFQGQTFGVPKPTIRYCDFKPEFRPNIRDVSPVNILSYDDLRMARLNLVISESGLNNIPEKIYISISPNAKLEHIIDDLILRIKEHLRQPKNRTRTDKWKYYIITFDFKKEHGQITFEKIADVFSNAYPEHKRTFDAKNCENYYKKALSLINGGYTRYLPS